MRLPLTDPEDFAKVDMAQVEKMVDTFLEHGFTYFDTAYMYHEFQSEKIVRAALVERHDRSAFTLATKLPTMFLKAEGDQERIFAEQLEKCGVDYFDYYLLHNVGGKRTAKFDEYGMWEFAQEQKAAGKIRFVGFSIHDDAACLEELLTAHPEVDFVQLQVNYLDWDDPVTQSARCMEVAAKHGVPVIIMEPVRGGMLASLSDEYAKKLETFRPDEEPAAWAFRFLQSILNIVVTLSGMSNFEQLEKNIRTYEEEKPLSAEEMDTLLGIADRMMNGVPCTACHYCTSHCPQGIDIPSMLKLYNEHKFSGGGFIAPMALMAVPEDKQPSACVGCRSCEAVCPQQIRISETLADFAGMLKA